MPTSHHPHRSHIDLLHINIVFVHRIAQERQRGIVLHLDGHLFEALAHLFAVIADVRIELNHHVVRTLHDLLLERLPRYFTHHLAFFRCDLFGSHYGLHDAVENVLPIENETVVGLVVDKRPFIPEMIAANAMDGQQKGVDWAYIGYMAAVDPLVFLLHVETTHFGEFATYLSLTLFPQCDLHELVGSQGRKHSVLLVDQHHRPRFVVLVEVVLVLRISPCTGQDSRVRCGEHYGDRVSLDEAAHRGVREGVCQRSVVFVEGFKHVQCRRREMTLQRNGETGIPHGGIDLGPREKGLRREGSGHESQIA